MDIGVVGPVMLLALGVVSLCVLTCVGARRRGQRPPVALVSGLFFPVTWLVWYVLDEHPYRH